MMIKNSYIEFFVSQIYLSKERREEGETFLKWALDYNWFILTFWKKSSCLFC